MSWVLTDVKYSLRQISRMKGALFWIFIFPVILLLLFGFIFGGQSGSHTVYYVDNDKTSTSEALIGGLNSTGALDLKDGSGMDLAQMLKDGKISAYIEIPSGFEQSVKAAGSSSNSSEAVLSIYYDRSKASSPAVISIVREVTNKMNMNLAGAKEMIAVNSQDVTTAGMSYTDFMLPGVIGISIMSSVVGMTVSSIAQLRDKGIFRKLATTPMSRVEWTAARIISQTILVMLSVAISLFVAWLAFGIQPSINALSILLMLIGTIMFGGLGMIIVALIKEPDTARSASSAITFPLMFVSGTFVAIEDMPGFLQWVADISPLTYLSNGLRSSMITENFGDAVTNLAIVSVICILLFGIGAATLSWKED